MTTHEELSILLNFFILEQLDIQAFLFLNGFHTESLDMAMAWITAKNSWIPFYVLIIFALIWKYRTKSIGMIFTIIIAITLSDQTASHLLKPLVGRLRPCYNPDIQSLIHKVGDCGGEFGFASSHAANCFSLVVCLYLLTKKQIRPILFLFIWAIIVSYSRIYVGVHYPLDVLAGAGIGTIYAILTTILYHKFFP